jgi:YNFM family putative membrane transporter
LRDGGFIAVFNIIGFRLTSDPFDLRLAAASLVYLVYPVGAVSSVVAGRLADRFGRRAVMPFGCLVAIAGVLLTVAPSLVVLIVGMALLTAGFFAVHGAGQRMGAGTRPCGGRLVRAGRLALPLHVLPRVVRFWQSGRSAWHAAGWLGVVLLAVLLFAVTAALALWLRRIPTLVTSPPR